MGVHRHHKSMQVSAIIKTDKDEIKEILQNYEKEKKELIKQIKEEIINE